MTTQAYLYSEHAEGANSAPAATAHQLCSDNRMMMTGLCVQPSLTPMHLAEYYQLHSRYDSRHDNRVMLHTESIPNDQENADRWTSARRNPGGVT